MMQSLTGKWQVTQVETPDAPTQAGGDDRWFDATVPGCVHTDLLSADHIPDPFYGLNDLEVQWVAETNWLYRRTFNCAEGLRAKERVELVCLGLDTFATVTLNGNRLGTTDNMFRTWRWDVTDILRDRDNELTVLFESPAARTRSLAAEDELDLRAGFEASRIYGRKAQYASGWDWGPNLNTSGIWKPLYLEGYDRARLADFWARVEWDDPSAPLVHVEAEIHALEPVSVALRAALKGSEEAHEGSASADLVEGSNEVVASFRVEDPKRWWPAGMGTQHLYELRVEADVAGETLTASRQVGLREVQLVREQDEQGESFVFRVNGEPVFCRGANWIPADNFLPRVTPEDYEDLLQRAADANMNMLRVWGGGIYESEQFYALCDRLGIMVWQDFMLACATYPEHLEEFRRNVRSEAEDAVRRLRAHPCVVLWCGNNECHWLYSAEEEDGGGSIYETVLPAVCGELDPTRPYWPGSPYGGEDANSPDCGDQHFWGPWWGWRSPESQRDFPGRFLSEFGLQAPPALETIRRYIPASGHHMQSRVMEHHNRAFQGTERLFKLLSGYFRVPGDFEDVVYLMQLMQGEGVKIGVEHWRSRKFRTAGTLFWQLNDCWPATSWSCLDYAHRPKALYYYAKRFFAPVLPVIEQRDESFVVRIVNDRPSPFEGELICGFGRLNGDQHRVDRQPCRVPANGVVDGPSGAVELPDTPDPARDYLWCRLIEDGREIARNARFLAPWKHVAFPRPEWEVSVESAGARRHVLRLSNWCFAKGVWLRVSGMEANFSDNFFDLFPELPVEVEVETPQDTSAAELERRLQIRSVAQSREGEA